MSLLNAVKNTGSGISSIETKMAEMEKMIVSRFNESLNRDNNIFRELEIIKGQVSELREITRQLQIAFDTKAINTPKSITVTKETKTTNSNDRDTLIAEIEAAKDIAELKAIKEKHDFFSTFTVFGVGVKIDKAKNRMIDIVKNNMTKSVETPTVDLLGQLIDNYKLNKKAVLTIIEEIKNNPDDITKAVLQETETKDYIKKELNHNNLGKDFFAHLESYCSK